MVGTDVGLVQYGCGGEREVWKVFESALRGSWRGVLVEMR